MIYNIIQELRTDNSRLFKEGVLKREKDFASDDLLQKVFKAALNPLKQYYIRKIPEYAHNIPGFVSPEKPLSLELAINELERLSRRELTGNAGVEHLRKILSSVHSADAEVIKLIIAKDLDCGVSISTVNKIWPDLIPEWPCMLASGYHEKLINKLKWPAYAQLKSDGMRCNAVINNGQVDFFARSGKPLDILGKLDHALYTLIGSNDTLSFAHDDGNGIVIDGELMVWNEDFTKPMTRKEGNGILTKANRGTISPEEAKRVYFVIWDWIPYNKFQSGYFQLPYGMRFSELKLATTDNITIQVIETKEVQNLEEAQVEFRRYLSEGYEGIILKDINAPWEDKRSKSLIKFKAELECDLLITGVEEGRGKYEGMVGAFCCESADGKVKVNVGTGISDAQRKEYWENKPIGKIAAIKYNEIIKASDGSTSLFLPVFVEVRFDKTEADTL